MLFFVFFCPTFLTNVSLEQIPQMEKKDLVVYSNYWLVAELLLLLLCVALDNFESCVLIHRCSMLNQSSLGTDLTKECSLTFDSIQSSWNFWVDSDYFDSEELILGEIASVGLAGFPKFFLRTRSISLLKNWRCSTFVWYSCIGTLHSLQKYRVEITFFGHLNYK